MPGCCSRAARRREPSRSSSSSGAGCPAATPTPSCCACDANDRPIVERVLRSARYRDVDRALLDRLAAEELPKSRNADDAVKRVKRRLHQAVGAFRGARAADPLAAVRATGRGDLADPAFRAACAARHAEPRLDRASACRTSSASIAPIWELTGGRAANAPRPRLRARSAGPALDGPPPDATYHACDVDRRSLSVVDAFLDLVGQPHEVHARDLVADGPPPAGGRRAAAQARHDARPPGPRGGRAAAARARRPARGRELHDAIARRPRRGMEPTYRRRLDELVAELGGRPRCARHRSRTSSSSC